MNKTECLVSVIVPCYNSSAYIERCLSSLEKQTYKNIEVIVVDDCSSDDTLKKITALEKSYKFKLQVINNRENIGPSLSRYKGVLAATGTYICFCDSDDWYDDVFIEKMLSTLLNADADMVFCGYKVVNNNNNKIEYRKLIFESQPTTKEESLVIDCDSLCMALMRKSIIDEIEVPDIRNGEDAALIPVLIQKSNSIHLISDCLYNYCRRKGSASQEPKLSTIDSLNKSFLFIKDHFPSTNTYEVEYLGIRNYLYPCEITLFSISYNRKEGLRLLQEFESSFPKWYKNKLIKKLPSYKRLILTLLHMRAFLLIRLVALVRLKKTR